MDPNIRSAYLRAHLARQAVVHHLRPTLLHLDDLLHVLLVIGHQLFVLLLKHGESRLHTVKLAKRLVQLFLGLFQLVVFLDEQVFNFCQTALHH